MLHTIALTAVVLLVAAPGDATTTKMTINSVPNMVEIDHDDVNVIRYRTGDVPYKPYADVLRTPSGVNILRDAPHDHLHHHALMFAVKVNDVNFWEERDAPGRQIHRGELKTGRIVEIGAGCAWFERAVDWLAPDDSVLLREHRRIEVHETTGVSLVTWSSTFTAPKPATLTGAHYHGFGMRFVESMDKDGAFVLPEGAEGELVRGTEYLTPAPWCAYAAKVDGKPVTVAMFDDPDNPRPVLWFTMTAPFAYLSATLNYWREPLEIPEDGKARLRYGIAVWDGHVTAETIQTTCAQWLASREQQ
ncbi:MAG: hypothetical protein GY851_05460 [bacterium]|nr:hypothetical protein [bacterium]